jgi:DNA-binding response OmpR family regulator
MEPGSARELHDYIVAEGGQVHSAAATGATVDDTEPAGPRVILVTAPDVPEAVSIVRRLYGSGSVRTILVGVHGGLRVRLAAWDAGADRVLPPATSKREVMAHIRAVSRRRAVGSPSSDDLTIRGWVFQLGRHQLLTPQGQRVALTARESRLLNALAARRGEIVTRDDLRLATGARDKGQTSRIMDRLVFCLRKKLEACHSDPGLISTVHGRGYALDRDDITRPDLQRLCFDLTTSPAVSVAPETTQPHNRRQGLINPPDRQPDQALPDNAIQVRFRGRPGAARPGVDRPGPGRDIRDPDHQHRDVNRERGRPRGHKDLGGRGG